uniref:(northern house mosquito) hypothetical protein n=1 Tax=Culex pipiens TaxID=7175 RepID=A0A8D8P7B4_CULPI
MINDDHQSTYDARAFKIWTRRSTCRVHRCEPSERRASQRPSSTSRRATPLLKIKLVTSRFRSRVIRRLPGSSSRTSPSLSMEVATSTIPMAKATPSRSASVRSSPTTRASTGWWSPTHMVRIRPKCSSTCPIPAAWTSAPC